MQIPWIYHKDYDIPLPKNHRFSSSKFGDLFSFLQKKDLYHNSKIYEPIVATEEQLLKVHTREYIDKIKYGTLTENEEKKLGLPWSNTLSKRSFLAVSGTFLTAKLALSNGIACHLAGGTHHAHKNYGSGFCVFNDIAFTAKNLLHEKVCKKILLIDCDVHQGDGTANICKDNENIYTCSIHAQNNFPYIKAESDLDIELPDDISEDAYLREIDGMLDKCMKNIIPDIVIYDAGVDVHVNDRLGRLSISTDGICKRDSKIIKFFKQKEIPIATVIGGGYSVDRLELAERHSIVFRVVDDIFNDN